MPHKVCPKCNKACGPRTLRCECGHSFFSLVDTLATAGGIVAGAVPVKKTTETPSAPIPVKKTTETPSAPIPVKKTTEKPPESLSGMVLTPAGKPPCKPDGDTDEAIYNWAEQVRAAGWEKGEQYAPEAVCYYARCFWDINSPVFRRVKNLIKMALSDNL